MIFFVYPDKDTPFDSVKASVLFTIKHLNPNTSNDSSTKLWKEKINFNKRGKCKLYLEKISTNSPEYEYHSEPLRQHRRFVEGGVFEGKDSETAKTADETNVSTKTPDYENHSEPLRQQRRFAEIGDFEEMDLKRTGKLIQLLKILIFELYFLVTAFISFSFQFYLNEDF